MKERGGLEQAMIENMKWRGTRHNREGYDQAIKERWKDGVCKLHGKLSEEGLEGKNLLCWECWREFEEELE